MTYSKVVIDWANGPIDLDYRSLNNVKERAHGLLDLFEWKEIIHIQSELNKVDELAVETLGLPLGSMEQTELIDEKEIKTMSFR